MHGQNNLGGKCDLMQTRVIKQIPKSHCICKIYTTSLRGAMLLGGICKFQLGSISGGMHNSHLTSQVG